MAKMKCTSTHMTCSGATHPEKPRNSMKLCLDAIFVSTASCRHNMRRMRRRSLSGQGLLADLRSCRFSGVSPHLTDSDGVFLQKLLIRRIYWWQEAQEGLAQEGFRQRSQGRAVTRQDVELNATAHSLFLNPPRHLM